MKVGLITYQIGHAKTRALAGQLAGKGHAITLFAFPFKQREPKPEPPRYQDRPAQIITGLDVPALCRATGMHYVAMTGWQDSEAERFTGCDVYLHCTAKIVPEAFIGTRKILNCHPGLLPENRGVDAFKWAIVKGEPVGVTLHKIDERIDGGTIMSCLPVPVYQKDTLDDLSRRMYDYELWLMTQFAEHLPAIKQQWRVSDEFPCSHQRIPLEQDQQLPALFERYKQAMALAA